MFKHLKSELPSSIVVYLVALPLCLGFVMADSAPVFSGLFTGLIEGSKLSAIFHGFLIIISLILIFKSLNIIPLYGLTTVLLL